MRLQQVVWNLLSNAINSRRAVVVFKFVRSESIRIEIVVSDTGQGISYDFCRTFSIVSDRPIRKPAGNMVAWDWDWQSSVIWSMHGGTVSANSEGEGKGATFTVSLPIAPVYQVDSSGSRVHPGARDLLPPNDVTDRLDDLKILVVDDEADTRELLRQGLEYCGATVSVAGSACGSGRKR